MRSTPDSPATTDEILAFGAFELDPAAMVLRLSGARLKLRAQPMQLLLLLVRSEGAVLTRDEIRAQLWEPDVHVDFSRGINACIKAIRTVLRDDAQAPRFIETLPGVGYRFIAPVERRRPPPAVATGRGEASTSESAPPEPEASPPAVQPPEASPPTVQPPERSPRSPRSKSWAAVSATVAVGVCVSLVAIDGRSPSAPPSGPSVPSARVLPSPAPPEAAELPLRLAVLPFVETGSIPEGGALGDALTWELIAELGRRHPERLEVIAMESMLRSRDRPHAPADLDRTLDADHVLQGTLVHGEQRLRLTFTLVRTRDGAVTWSDTRELAPGDLAALQAEVSDELAHALALELLPRRPEPVVADVPAEAYQAYLRGRAALARLSLAACSRAADELDAALALAPELAAAHAARARVWEQCPAGADDRGPRAREAAHRAIELDPQHVEAHVILGRIVFYYDLDLEAARQWFERALELDPGCAEAHHALAMYHAARGRPDAAMRSLERARRLDPLSPSISADFGWVAYFSRRHHQAIADCRAILELAPEGATMHMCIVQAALALQDHTLAAEHARAFMEHWTTPAEVEAVVREQPTDTLREVWRALLAKSEAEGLDANHQWQTVLRLLLGQPDEALEQLQRTYDARQGWRLPFLAVDPLMDPLRDEDGFRALLAQIEASRSPLRPPSRDGSRPGHEERSLERGRTP